jgi:hypothetical protein
MSLGSSPGGPRRGNNRHGCGAGEHGLRATATGEAIFPAASTRAAEGVPSAPNARLTAKPSSSTIGDRNPIARFALDVTCRNDQNLRRPRGQPPSVASGPEGCARRGRSPGSRRAPVFPARGTSRGRPLAPPRSRSFNWRATAPIGRAPFAPTAAVSIGGGYPLEQRLDRVGACGNVEPMRQLRLTRTALGAEGRRVARVWSARRRRPPAGRRGGR